MMRRKAFPLLLAALVLVLLLALIVVGRGRNSAAPAPAAQPDPTVGQAESSGTEAAPAEPAGTVVVDARRDGERFEDVIILEGMEETVRYEHVRNDALGFAFDYDYENFVRRSEADCERFISDWDDPAAPENYLELRYSAADAATVAAVIGETLSQEYEISREDAFPLANAPGCIRIDASADKGGLTMPDQLQAVYIIPAADGCRIAAAHYAIEGSEGFGRRFRYMMESFCPIAAQGEHRLTEDQALAAARRHRYLAEPELKSAEASGEYPLYWEIEASGEQEIVVLFRSYTGAQLRYHIDPVSGSAYITEFVPGISSGETRTEDSLNAWAYLA